jgi:hypothetical protein
MKGKKRPAGKVFRAGRMGSKLIWTACPRCISRHRRR